MACRRRRLWEQAGASSWPPVAGVLNRPAPDCDLAMEPAWRRSSTSTRRPPPRVPPRRPGWLLRPARRRRAGRRRVQRQRRARIRRRRRCGRHRRRRGRGRRGAGRRDCCGRVSVRGPPARAGLDDRATESRSMGAWPLVPKFANVDARRPGAAGSHRQRPPGHGHSPQPGDQPAPVRRPHQHRPGPTSPRPPSRPGNHARDQHKNDFAMTLDPNRPHPQRSTTGLPNTYERAACPRRRTCPANPWDLDSAP